MNKNKDSTALIEKNRSEGIKKLDQKKRGILGQFMTPATIAHYMASLFCLKNKMRLLDAGAGTGSLSLAFIDRVIKSNKKSVQIDAWEICEPIFTYDDEAYHTYEFAFLDNRKGIADSIRLNNRVNLLPAAASAIRSAEVLIIGPGDIHFSLLPPMLTKGFIEVLSTVQQVIIVANLTARKIDIPGFTLKGFVEFWQNILPAGPEYHVIVNDGYIMESDEVILKDDIVGDSHNDYQLHRAAISGDTVSRNDQLLHDEVVLGKVLQSLI